MSAFTTSDGEQLYIEKHKRTGEHLLFIHGWPHNHSVWKHEEEALAKNHYTTTLLDLRGHGKSSTPQNPEKYSMQRFAEDIREYIQSQNHPVTAIGHSFGGMVLLEALNKPLPKLQRLVLIDSSHKNPLRTNPLLKELHLTPLLEHILKHVIQNPHLQNKHFPSYDFSTTNHTDFYYWLQGAHNTSAQVVLDCMYDMLEFDATKNLSTITHPTLIIVGEQDHRTPPIEAQYLHDHIKNSKLVTIKQATHDTNMQNPNRVAQEIHTFIQETP